MADWLTASRAASTGMVDIGEIGFRSGVKIFDFAGLTNRRIGHASGPHLNKRFDLDYLFSERWPEVLVFRCNARPEWSADGAMSISYGGIMSPVERL